LANVQAGSASFVIQTKIRILVDFIISPKDLQVDEVLTQVGVEALFPTQLIIIQPDSLVMLVLRR
jgi:hypothetical protein